jgi:hypothetical protein
MSPLRGDREQVKEIFQRFLPITLNIPSISKFGLVGRRKERRGELTDGRMK